MTAVERSLTCATKGCLRFVRWIAVEGIWWARFCGECAVDADDKRQYPMAKWERI